MKNYKIQEIEQEIYFNISRNQYSVDSILNPSLHTLLEEDQIIKLLNNDSKKTILEFGAGTGRLTIYLLKKKFKVFAVDISKKSLESLKKTARLLKLNNLKTFTTIPKNRSFEFIVGADILHHIDIDKYIPLFYSSLRRGGEGNFF